MSSLAARAATREETRVVALDVVAFVGREAGPLLDYFARRADSLEDAADLLSETLVVIWRRSRQMPQHPDEARMWTYGVARHVLHSHRRSLARRSALSARLSEELLASQDVSGPPSEVRDTVREAVRQLPERDREIVGLVYWEGFSLEEVARILSMKPATVRSRHQRARERLRGLLAGEVEATSE